MDLENSNPSFEVVSPEMTADDSRTTAIDTSCCSGHTCSTRPLSDYEDYDEQEYESHIWNTHTSILNITGSDDEDDEEDQENEPMMMPEQLILDDNFSSSPEFAPQQILSDESNISTQQDHSLIDRMGDLMDSFCVSSTSKTQPDSQLEQDLVQLMSCYPPPDAQEIKVFANTKRLLDRLFCHKHDDSTREATPHKRHQRSRKIHRLLQARRLPHAATLRSVHSFSVVANRGHIFPEEKNAYDSDPEDLVRSHKRHYPTPTRKSPLLLTPTIQQTLNSTWDLLLHDNCDSLQTVQVWMERGTLIHVHSMIEPRIMWRTQSMDAPQSIWLLQISRIRACNESDEIPTMAPMNKTFLLRTHKNTYYFQAESTQSRDAIVNAWKTTIARFAALAVLEDANSILNEFFVLPTL